MTDTLKDRAARELEIERYRQLARETTDPIAVHLLGEIIGEMEIDFLSSEKEEGQNQSQKA